MLGEQIVNCFPQVLRHRNVGISACLRSASGPPTPRYMLIDSSSLYMVAIAITGKLLGNMLEA